MLSYGYWQRRFGGDPGVVGRTIQVNAQTRVIAGVMPRGFKMVDYDFDLLIPLALDPSKRASGRLCVSGIARLRPGVSIAQADADVARLLNVWMDSWTNGPGRRSALVSALEDHARSAAAERYRGRQHPDTCFGW